MESTFNDLGAAMLALANHRRATAGDRAAANGQPREAASAAARDLSIAITHLEDALTRYNSACYRLTGTWFRRDRDKPSAVMTLEVPPALTAEEAERFRAAFLANVTANVPNASA